MVEFFSVILYCVCLTDIEDLTHKQIEFVPAPVGFDSYRGFPSISDIVWIGGF
jgi:hypothetical protein